MAKTDPKVMTLVERELEKNPDASVDELYKKAKAKDASISELSHRQFHARYPLQVKRRKGGKARTRRTRKKKTMTRSREKASAGQDDRRDKVRDTFLRFATDLTAAEERSHLVKVLANVDSYVKQVLKVTRG